MVLSPLQELSFHPRCSILQILGPVIQIHKPISQNNLLMILWHMRAPVSKTNWVRAAHWILITMAVLYLRLTIESGQWSPFKIGLPVAVRGATVKYFSGVPMAHLFSKVLANIWASSMLVNVTKRMISQASVTCKNMSKKFIEVCKRVMDREQDE
jgi:hypothetical protein